MKSGQRTDNRLIGPGSNNYGRDEDTIFWGGHHTCEKCGRLHYGSTIHYCEDDVPILVDMKLKQNILSESQKQKLIDAILSEKKYDAHSEKQSILHHLKQLKAQMGKLRLKAVSEWHRDGIEQCMDAIDKKIAKI